MESRVRLVKPSMKLKEQYLDFYEEWIHSGEEMVPWVIKRDPSDFEDMLKFLGNTETAVDLPEGWVPSTTSWLVDSDDNVVGAVNIRHSLNNELMNRGGHIGYGIRPSARRRGYATELLKQSLQITKELGISRVLVVCDAVNIASERTIRNNGGIEDIPYTEEDGNVIKRFWIEA
ncbi:GNAT family N-acetyltransferase [Paenibacillus sp. sgz500958]|uniref:GNAT family N-acetyltransferase n=1 Tax=Paenibacillus sp. sgz500958 TaxID=3242475 RepID=UPI0036D3EED9